MVQKAENPYCVRFGPQGNRLAPQHLFSRKEYLEMASFLDNTPCTILYSILTKANFYPHIIRNTILKDLEYFENRYDEIPIPGDPEDLDHLNQFEEIADCALRRAAVLYEPLEEAISFLGTEDDSAILWRLQRGK
jgi:hypothetical protein